jgi:hypothetical protein
MEPKAVLDVILKMFDIPVGNRIPRLLSPWLVTLMIELPVIMACN